MKKSTKGKRKIKKKITVKDLVKHKGGVEPIRATVESSCSSPPRDTQEAPAT